jgi:hypothetical protein
MIATESNIGDLKSGLRWADADIDTRIIDHRGPSSGGLAARLLRGLWHAFRDGAAMYAASHWVTPDSATLWSDAAPEPCSSDADRAVPLPLSDGSREGQSRAPDWPGLYGGSVQEGAFT